MLLDLEIMLIGRFHWSLHDLDQTDAVSLFDLLGRMIETGGEGEAAARAYCDQVTWM